MSLSGSDTGGAPASITVRNLSLVVPYYVQPDKIASSWLSTLFGAALSVPRRRFATILDDLSFSVSEGERIALVGRNGAGKSSLLRVLAGAFQPTSGSIETLGSKQALLSIGVGFSSEATVMENIFLRATAMGIPSADIKELVEPVLEFSGLRNVANRRLLTLSSGQRVRLGFALSTAVQTDIVLLDEWFGAGDAQFVRKARRRMTDRVDGSKIVIVASHNESLLRKLCNRALLIDQGRLVMDGSVADVLGEYQKLHPRIEADELARAKAERRAMRRATRRAAMAVGAGVGDGAELPWGEPGSMGELGHAGALARYRSARKRKWRAKRAALAAHAAIGLAEGSGPPAAGDVEATASAQDPAASEALARFRKARRAWRRAKRAAALAAAELLAITQPGGAGDGSPGPEAASPQLSATPGTRAIPPGNEGKAAAPPAGAGKVNP